MWCLLLFCLSSTLIAMEQSAFFPPTPRLSRHHTQPDETIICHYVVDKYFKKNGLESTVSPYIEKQLREQKELRKIDHLFGEITLDEIHDTVISAVSAALKDKEHEAIEARDSSRRKIDRRKSAIISGITGMTTAAITAFVTLTVYFSQCQTLMLASNKKI